MFFTVCCASGGLCTTSLEQATTIIQSEDGVFGGDGLRTGHFWYSSDEFATQAQSLGVGFGDFWAVLRDYFYYNFNDDLYDGKDKFL